MISTFKYIVAAITDAVIFLKTVTFKKIGNGFLLRLSYFISKTFRVFCHWGQVESLSIEPTNLCNLKCPECPSGNNSMTRPRLFLSQSDFERTINELAGFLSYLQLFFQGEPFLHPKIYDYIKFAASKKVYTSISTNGQFLSVENCEKIIHSGLQRLIISVDGTTQETYEKYRVGGSLDLVINGINQLVRSKKIHKSKTPFIIMQFVVFASNEHQIPDIKKLALELKVNRLQIKTAQIENFENGNSLIPINQKYSRYKHKGNGNYKLNRNENFKCKRVWNSAVISADNKLLPCCFDKNAEYAYNQIEKGNITKLWKGEKAQSFRSNVWSKNNHINICKNCSEGLK